MSRLFDMIITVADALCYNDDDEKSCLYDWHEKKKKYNCISIVSPIPADVVTEPDVMEFYFRYYF